MSAKIFRATDSNLVPQNAAELRSMGVIPYTVGVGNNINVGELRVWKFKQFYEEWKYVICIYIYIRELKA